LRDARTLFPSLHLARAPTTIQQPQLQFLQKNSRAAKNTAGASWSNSQNSLSSDYTSNFSLRTQAKGGSARRSGKREGTRAMSDRRSARVKTVSKSLKRVDEDTRRQVGECHRSWLLFFFKRYNILFLSDAPPPIPIETTGCRGSLGRAGERQRGGGGGRRRR
jgi:hypothetical protein